MSELQEQLQRAMMLDQERRRAEEEAIRLESERQAALVAKEELAREAENQKKSQEQLVSILMTSFNYLKLKLKLAASWSLCEVFKCSFLAEQVLWCSFGVSGPLGYAGDYKTSPE